MNVVVWFFFAHIHFQYFLFPAMPLLVVGLTCCLAKMLQCMNDVLHKLMYSRRAVQFSNKWALPYSNQCVTLSFTN